MVTAERYGPWALIAGGSEGVAASFARQLANVGMNLVLVARRPEPLERLALELKSHSHVQVRTVSVDLSRPDVLDPIREATDDVDVGLLIFNAGHTDDVFGSFLDRPIEKALGPVQVAAVAQTRLAHHFGSRMAARGRGGIILVGSLSGNAGVANMATYCGAKAFSQMFAEALWSELKPRGVDVLSLVLGVTDTPARARNGVADIPGIQLHDPDDVAQQALDNLADGGPVHVPPSIAQMFQYLCATPRRPLAEQLSGVASREFD